MTLRGQLIAEKEKKNSRKPQKVREKAEAARKNGSTQSKNELKKAKSSNGIIT